MITTITTAVSTIVSSTEVSGLLASLGAAAVLTLIASLVMKELATQGAVRMRLFSHNLSIITLPLFFVFSFILSIKAWELLA